MSAEATKILQKALGLSDRDRAELAASLIESLDQAFDPDIEEVWWHEVSRRVKQIDSGDAVAIDWHAARSKIAG